MLSALFQVNFELELSIFQTLILFQVTLENFCKTLEMGIHLSRFCFQSSFLVTTLFYLEIIHFSKELNLAE